MTDNDLAALGLTSPEDKAEAEARWKQHEEDMAREHAEYKELTIQLLLPRIPTHQLQAEIDRRQEEALKRKQEAFDRLMEIETYGSLVKKGTGWKGKRK